MAPNFNVVVSPKSTEVDTTSRGPKQHSERQIRYQKFFSNLIERIKARPPRVTNLSRIGYDSWVSTSSGKSGFTFGLAFTASKRFQIELYIDLGNRLANKNAFDELLSSRESIDEELEATLDWQRLDNRRASRIAWFWEQTVTILDDDKKLEELIDWALPKYFNFRQAMSQPLEKLPTYDSKIRPLDDQTPSTPDNSVSE